MNAASIALMASGSVTGSDMTPPGTTMDDARMPGVCVILDGTPVDATHHRAIGGMTLVLSGTG
jgi:hypothetical protein